MTYDTIATFSQVTSLLMFMAMFAGVIAYVLWPGNKTYFEKVQNSALDLDGERARSHRDSEGRT